MTQEDVNRRLNVQQAQAMDNVQLMAELVTKVNAIPSRLDDLLTIIKETAEVARLDREEIKANQRITNGRLRDIELIQARHEGALMLLKWLVPLTIAAPAAIVALEVTLR